MTPQRLCRHSRAPRGVLAVVALLLLSLVAGCAGPEPGSRPIGEVIRDAIEQAKERAQRDSADVGEQAPPQQEGRVIRADTRTEFNYEQYQSTLRSVIQTLDEYWSTTLPRDFGVRYTPPRGGYFYYRPDDRPGPKCGNEEAPAKNAFYCPPGDFIAWDESGLMIPYYVQGGDFAAAFVLAHEFGHAMQFRLPRQEELGVLRELQADCFAGAWSRHVEQRGMLEAGDLDEATMAVFTARDVPGTPYTDPRAHGTGFERTRAFADGYEGGAKACHPARGEKWLISR
ncbi:MAG: neutral zinc metallopeptidase [Actinomycetota bacterium]|nr:neutral zinc metallopeptidase [Actinomycetota bacterium]